MVSSLLSTTLATPMVRGSQSNRTSQPSSSLASVHFSDRVFLPSEPQHLWQIERGIIRTYTWNAHGNITTLGIWGKGDIVGQSLSNLTPYVIQSLGPVDARPMIQDNSHNPDDILRHAQQLTTLLRIISIKRADDRLLGLLKWLAQRFGYITPMGTCTQLPMTHQELAETANIARVTATRLIGDMEEQGILQWSRKRQFVLLPRR